jgi:Putative lactococcus lactis phage r1t holin
MQNIFTKAFWLYAGERAIKTIAQSALALLAVNQTTIISVDLKGLVASAITAGIISLLTSIVSSPK